MKRRSLGEPLPPLELRQSINGHEMFGFLSPSIIQLTQPIIPNKISPEPPKQKYYSFCKILTTSDTSTHGGFSIMRKHAMECLPPLGLTQTTPIQAKDLHDFEWKFHPVYRGQPKKHLFTTECSIFVTSKRLLLGHTLVFPRFSKWIMFSNWKLNASVENKQVLSKAVAIFHERFDPIVDSNYGHDFIPTMLFGRNIKGQDFGRMYCAVLTINQVVVSVGIFCIFGPEVSELPLVAAIGDYQGQG